MFWSEHWYIEGNEAWFVGGRVKALFKVDLVKNDCRLISIIPDLDMYKYRSYPGCVKYENKIFCLPYDSDIIWIYNLLQDDWRKINVFNSKKEWIGIWDFWRRGEELWCIAKGVRQVIKINLKKESVEQYWDISQLPDELIGGSIMVGNDIFIVSHTRSQIYIFNICSHQIKLCIIPDIGDKLSTITFDGKNFLLCGYRKAVYLWNREQNTMRIITEFPDKFGTYSKEGETKEFWDHEALAFFYAKCMGENIFFLPLRVNQVLYFNKNTYEAHSLEIQGEDEMPQELKNEARPMKDKYSFEYIRENRFLGVYSFKNQIVFEIDTLKMEVIHRKIDIKDEDINLLQKKDVLNCIEMAGLNKEANNLKKNVPLMGKDIYYYLKNNKSMFR